MKSFGIPAGFASAAALVALIGVHVAGLGLLAAGLSHAATSRSHDAGPVAMDAARAGAVIARAATMNIVPAVVIDPRAGFFIGTGNGSEGAWILP